MTVCIAAICDGGSGIVVASDRMVTGVDVEFEQDNLKIDSLTNLCVALTAGSAIEHVDLLRECRSIAQQTTAPAIFDVAEIVKERFVTLRRKRAEELYFSPLGLDIESFFEDQSSLSPDLVLRLVRTLEVEELNLEMLVAGTDNSGGHIYLVHDPGVASCMDALGFCCIGSGEHHATMTFVRTGYSVRTPLHRALYLAYQAKGTPRWRPAWENGSLTWPTSTTMNSGIQAPNCSMGSEPCMITAGKMQPEGWKNWTKNLATF